MQHVDNDGNLMFDYPGPKIIDDPSPQTYPEVCSDRNGGMIFAFKDYRHAGNPDIYAQRIGRDGVGLWEHDGVPVFVDPQVEDYDQKLQSLSDGSVVITWKSAVDFPNGQIRAQRVSPMGEALWDSAGLLLIGNEIAEPWDPDIVVDSMDNIFIAWTDHSDDSIFAGIYFQKLDLAGNNYWGEEGTRGCYGIIGSLAFDYYSFTSDGNGGVFVTWYDHRFGPIADVFAAWTDSMGEPRWGLEWYKDHHVS